MTVLQLADVGAYLGFGSVRCEVEALPLGAELGCEPIDGVLGHEVVYLKGIDANLRFIGLSSKVVACVSMQAASTFVYMEHGVAQAAFDGQVCLEVHAVGYGEGTIRSGS